jgi:hypothetical protein
LCKPFINNDLQNARRGTDVAFDTASGLKMVGREDGFLVRGSSPHRVGELEQHGVL